MGSTLSPILNLSTIGTKDGAANYLLERLHSSHSTWERIGTEQSHPDCGVVLAHTNDRAAYASVSSIGISEYLTGKRIRDFMDKGICRVPPRFFDTGLNDLQKQALRVMCIEPVSCVNGLPGVGKTFSVRRAVEHQRALGKNVIGCAFTGSAAARLSESTNMTCKTVHMLLGYNGESFERNEDNPLLYDHVFIDELSQLGSVLFWNLIRSIRPGCQVTVLGDTNQIRSIEPGDVLAQLSRSIPTVTLKETVRADSQSPVGQALLRMLDGLPPEELGSRSEGGVFFRVCADSDLPRICHAGMMRIREIENCSEIDVRSLTYTNNVCDGVNNYCNRQFPRGTRIPVVARKNNYNRGYFNGEAGTLLGDVVSLYDGRVAQMSADFDLGFCSTINVAQGQQFRGVSVAVPSEGIGLPNRNFAITAASRAEKWVMIAGSHRNFTEALRRTDFKRTSLLGQFIRGTARIVNTQESQ